MTKPKRPLGRPDLPPIVRCTACEAPVPEAKPLRDGSYSLCRPCADKLFADEGHCEVCFCTLDTKRDPHWLLSGLGLVCCTCKDAICTPPEDHD
jgi:hypothetical protein